MTPIAQFTAEMDAICERLRLVREQNHRENQELIALLREANASTEATIQNMRDLRESLGGQ